MTPPFRGYDPAMFPVAIARPAIQPAGYAFAIWGPIYLWLIAHAIFGLWQRHDNPAWQRTRLPLTGAVWLGAVGLGAVWLGAVWLGAVWLGAVWLGAVWLAIAQNYPITATVTILAMAALALTPSCARTLTRTAGSCPPRWRSSPAG